MDGTLQGVILPPSLVQQELPLTKPVPHSSTHSRKPRDNRIRIIGGSWRGRKLSFPDGDGLRPTGDRIRETLFNWLSPVLPGARCLDLFAGSGALGFEALSRGAASCVLVERNAQAVRHLQENKRLLVAGGAVVVAADSAHWLQSASGVFDIVFIDPPFADATLAPSALVSAMEQRGLLAPAPWVYVEQPANAMQAPLPQGFTQYRSQRAGQVCYSLWRRPENSP